MESAVWLEADDEFEGVGAHRLNPRYDPVDEPVPQSVERLAHLPVPKFSPIAPVGLAPLMVAPYRLDGHDGSHHQFDAGPVDLNVLAASTWIIWWKATQSIRYIDPTFGTVWSQRDLFRNRSAYHWLSSTTDPVQQAAHFLEVIGTLGAGDGAMLDAEEAGITAAECLAWCEAVEAVTHRPASVYTGLYVSGGSIWKSDALRTSEYGPRPFHVAAYVTEASLRARMISTGSQNYPWQAWQFSSNGPVPGITGRADMNRVDDRDAYDLATAFSQPLPPEPEKPPVVVIPDPPPPLGADMSVLDTPVRVWDSRAGSPQGGNGKHSQGETFLVNVTNHVPAPVNARGVIVGLHVLEADSAGYLTVWGAGGRPGTSNINFVPGVVSDTLAVVPLSGGGINTFTSASCNVIVDVQGWVA